MVRMPCRYLAKMLHDTPLVITAHSLEPFRPWNVNSWAAATI